MIYRYALSYLEKWKENPLRKPLILRGARQVGKTTLVENFANGFDCFLKLNLDEEEDRRLFTQYNDIHKLIEAIFFYLRKSPMQGTVLLFIDEIQNSSEAVAMLRYFYEKRPDIYVIAAGSLLENVIDRKISFPVGRVEYMTLHPCSFLEYLNGIGEDFDRQALEDLKADAIHDRLMYEFRKYCIVGGMPEAVNRYAQTKDLLSLDTVYDALIASYSDDIEKYSPNDTQTRIMRHILDTGWQKGGETITFECFGGSAYRSREVGEAFRTIQKAMLLELVYPTLGNRLPLEAQLSRRPKLIWLDTGLMNYKAEVREEVFSVSDISDAYRGHVAEQVVAQELLAHTTRLSEKRYYWVGNKRNSTAEVDFVWKRQPYVLPIEVKSGTNAHLRSLHLFMSDAPHDLAIRVWSNRMSVDEVKEPNTGKIFRLLNIPFYYVGVLDKIVNTLI
ncbi:ATP-binding protein [Parabacteroides sp.]